MMEKGEQGPPSCCGGCPPGPPGPLGRLPQVVVGLDLSSVAGICVIRPDINCDFVSVKKTEWDTDVKFSRHIVDQIIEFSGRTRLEVFVENTYVGPNSKVSMRLAELRGLVIGHLDQETPCAFHRPLPSEWKKWATGNGGSKKDAVIANVQSWGYELPTLTPKGKKLDDNVADAIAIAHYGRAKLFGPVPGIGNN
jgi:Holliday junction resolvasome RuvABC endonuclease subunit